MIGAWIVAILAIILASCTSPMDELREPDVFCGWYIVSRPGLAPPPELADCIEDAAANGETARGISVWLSPDGEVETAYQSDLPSTLIRVSIDRQPFDTVMRCDLDLIADPAGLIDGGCS